jgi:hypothetical protein
LGRKEGDSRGLAAAGFAQDQGMAVGRLCRRVARFMEAEPMQRALQRLEQRDRRRQGRRAFSVPVSAACSAAISAKLIGRHRHVARPVVHVAGVHGEERSLERCDLAHEPHAVLMRDAADAGDLGIERRLICQAKTVMVI